MAIKGDKAQWSDISLLYSKLNTARNKFGFSQVSDPNRKNLVTKATDISSLSAFIDEMRSNSFLSGITATNLKPTVGSLMQPSFLDTMNNTIDQIQNTCAFGNSSFGDTGFSFGNTSFGNSSFGDTGFSFGNTGFGNSSFGDTGFSFGNTGFSNSSFRNSSFGNTGFGNTGFGNSSFSNSSFNFGNSSFGDTSFGNTSFGNSSFGNSSFSCSSFNFGFGVWFRSYSNRAFDNR